MKFQNGRRRPAGCDRLPALNVVFHCRLMVEGTACEPDGFLGR